jgi:hypothetical protein
VGNEAGWAEAGFGPFWIIYQSKQVIYHLQQPTLFTYHKQVAKLNAQSIRY